MRDEYILDRLMQDGTASGQQLSEEMGISRAAVWKYILKLREAGYFIEAAPHTGYRLIPPADSIYPFMIYAGLETDFAGHSVKYRAEVDSTNLRAREWAQNGAPDGALWLADRQSAGRGRLNRAWESPSGSGIYMSLVLRPGVPVQRLPLLTPVVALGVCRALSQFCEDAVRIKWPNDIVCSGRKICGMLLDAQAGMDGVDWVVAGIGINVHQKLENFPPEVQRTAASLDMLTGRRCIRSLVICAVLREIEKRVQLWLAGRDDDILREYAMMSATLGQRVRVISQTGEYEAVATGIQEDGALLVKPDDGDERPVYAGDVSVRGIMGYSV